MTAYSIELGNPGAEAKNIFDRIASIDGELYKARESAAQIAVLDERAQVMRALGSHYTLERRIRWYKEHHTDLQTLILQFEDTFHPDSLSLFMTHSERQDLRDAVQPAWQATPFPIRGKHMTDDPLETALFTLIGDVLRRKRSEDEFAMLQTIVTYEDLLRFRALHSDAGAKLMAKADAEAFLASRQILRDALTQKFQLVQELASRFEIFRKHPSILQGLAAAVGNWLLFIEFAYWRALPYHPGDAYRLEMHMGECYLNARMALRKAYSLLSRPEFGLVNAPVDLPSETPYGINPTELAFKVRWSWRALLPFLPFPGAPVVLHRS